MAALTAWQLGVVRLAAEGLTLREISLANGVALSTTKEHMDKARRTLEARTIAHAVAIAFRLGLLR